MKASKMARRIGLGLVLATGCALGLVACGGTGPLAQPPPLFGHQARSDYDAQKAAAARAAREQQQNATQSNAIADKEENTTADDQPKSTRDIPDPNQLMTDPRNAPVPGANNLAGPTVSTTPPN